MFSLVHISDIHIGYSRRTDANAIALTQFIISNFLPATVVVITGDLVHHGAEEEYERLVSTVLAPLRERFTVLTCPGNHDYSSNWFGAKLSEDSVRSYRQHVGGEFPQVHAEEADRTVLIGMDSADPKDRVWFSGGLIDGRQVVRLRELLEEHGDKMRIVYFHHHPFMWRAWLAMFGSSALLRTMAESGADLAMFGHKHWSQIFCWTKGVPLMLASRKSTKQKLFSRKLSFRVVEIADGEVIGVRSEEFRPNTERHLVGEGLPLPG